MPPYTLMRSFAFALADGGELTIEEGSTISFDRNAMPGMQPLPEFNKAGRQSALHRAAGDLGRRQALMSGRMEVVPESERHKPPRLPPNE